MENQGPLILDISSDEETGFADVRKGGDCEFGDREDVDWLSKVLVEAGGKLDDDSDDVVFVSEVLASNTKKSRSESLKPLPKVVADDDDGDCMILDGDPDKSIVVVNDKVDANDDSDDLEIVGEKGEVACRDFPHPRHHCAKHPFASTLHNVHCDQCHCYVCDSPAPCSHWGTGFKCTDHCHASDKDEYWKAERKLVKKGDKTKSDIHNKGGTRLESYFPPIQVPGCSPAQPNSFPQNQAVNPVAIRPCALSSNVSLPNAINRGRSQPSGYVAPRYNPRSQLVSVQLHHGSTNIVGPKVAFRNKSYPVGSQNPQHFRPSAAFKRSGANNRHAYRFQLPPNRRPPAFQVPLTNGHHGSNQQIVGSQDVVSSIPLPELSSHNMDSAHANYLSSDPQMNSQSFSSYQNPVLIPHQSQMSSQPFVNGDSLSSPTSQSYTYSQPCVRNIESSVASEPYNGYVPINSLLPQTAASYQSDAGNTFANQHLGSTIPSLSSLGNSFDSGSSQLHRHNCPNSLLTSGQNDVQQHHNQSGRDASSTNFSFFCDSPVDHGKMQTHAEQSQYPSTAPAETSQSVDILPRESVELPAAYTSPINHADSQLPESKEPGSFDFNFFDSWTFENESFSGALEASAPPNWNIYSPEPAFTDTGTLFDI